MGIDLGLFGMDGKPISMDEWMRLMKRDDERRVGYTKIDDQAFVSTVLLGLEHGRDKQGRPIIFESMVFGDDDNNECMRYATLEDAKRGHAKLVAMVRARRTSAERRAGEPLKVKRVKIEEE